MLGNPATDGTAVRFGLTRKAPVDIRIYDVAGRVARRLAVRPYDAGTDTIRRDGRGDAGKTLVPGVYFITYDTGARSFSKKVIVIR